MATHSQPPSQAHSPIDQGQLESLIPPASPELSNVSLEQVIRLLWGLQSQVDCIKQALLEQAKISQEVQTNVENISQTVNIVKDGLAQLQLPQGPHTPEEQKPLQLRKFPGPCPKPSLLARLNPSLGPQLPSSLQGLQGATPSPSSIPTPPCPSLQDQLQPLLPKDLHQRPKSLRRCPSPLRCKSGPPRCLQRQNWLGGQAVADTNVSLGTSQSEAVSHGPGGPIIPPHEHDRGQWSLGPSPFGPTGVPLRTHPNRG
ncbi:hypothetical protein RHS01_06133 [Rhizoctonia solani]|uniref:Uncharacterized protein n=1 Tax=Rhizoctonia solani TaxID=456999 RepID=A0A8H7IBV1_9AGAM|nr:hypothetical protein RHS01_06133 [Rhizoctonia solani]